MAFTGSEDHSISLQEASQLTANYRSQAGDGAVLASFFGKQTIQKILDQEDCVGIRIYYGLENSTPVLVLVGAKANEDDIISGELAQTGVQCPPVCGSANDLNS